MVDYTPFSFPLSIPSESGPSCLPFFSHFLLQDHFPHKITYFFPPPKGGMVILFWMWMFHLVLDGSKYIAVREKLTIADAQKYCSHKYQNGTLGSFADPSDRPELVNLLQAERRGRGLERGSGSCTCINGPCAEEECSSIGSCNKCLCTINCANGGSIQQCMGCSRRLYFICKVNKGNDIYSWLL
jgi:hypothetical protein